MTVVLLDGPGGVDPMVVLLDGPGGVDPMVDDPPPGKSGRPVETGESVVVCWWPSKIASG